MPTNAIPHRAKHVGVCPPARGAIINKLVCAHPSPVWLIVAVESKLAEQLAEDLAFFENAASSSPTPRIYTLPESMPGARDMREAFAASADRLTVLSALRNIPQGKIILTTPSALLQPVPALDQFATTEFTLTRGQTHSFKALIEKLNTLDYDSEAVCETPGSYAVRGGIIDVYPVTATRPCRLDFFGDDIEDIRTFDPVTQRSAESVASITLSASPRVKLDTSKTGLADYLPAGTHMLLVEPAAMGASLASSSQPPSLANTNNANATPTPNTPTPPAPTSPSLANTDGANDALMADALAPFFPKLAALIGISDIDEATALFDTPDTRETVWETDSLVHHRGYPSNALVANERLQAEENARARFLKQVAAWVTHDGYALTIITAREGEENRAREILAGNPAFRKIKPRYLRGTLNEGFRITRRDNDDAAQAGLSAPHSSQLYLTETELFGRQRARHPAATATQRRALVQRAQVDQLLDFAELVEGDFVVHIQHGIAIYRGLAKINHAAGIREVISLEFDDGVTLHVPLQESHLVSRYVGLAKTRPQLGRIGTNRWEKTRRAAEVATIDLAAELLRLQASREAQTGHAFSADTAWQKEFEDSFPFTETRDQLRAIVETKTDMERPRGMDRLICGDVGFGKTEVAIRAAFKAVQDSRQVAVLVPTTVLAQQHLNTFRERMAGYPIVVEMISRFRTRAEQRKITAATAAGQVDILIGTHRLLQEDIAFRDLGLVVIDEEQRFGVKHKERLKTMRATVDVLSMSATPIPRTLYMALTGARDMSVIETAPTNRHPIQTMVKTYDEKIIVDAVRHELRRGGQVFYLHNRVQTIDLAATRLRDLMPGVRIGVGHGRMHEHGLERVMTDFVAGKYDILVCTTIIESGLDIPNCNTIIIEGADRFGLSQLYQLRGRVGRFKHQAYAYLLLHRHTHLIEIARQRLNALRSHNQLGAGFRIAMRDLELRGAGNLLGAEQSGHIVGVGFELYCQLLRQSVARLNGEKAAATIRATVKLDFVRVGETDEPAAPRAPPAVPDAPPAGSSAGPSAGSSAESCARSSAGSCVTRTAGLHSDSTARRGPVPARHEPATRATQSHGLAARATYVTAYSEVKAAEDEFSGIVPIVPIQARIPVAYISETRLRIDIYRRLALADSLEALKQIVNDLRDRFGKYGNEMRALFLVTEIRIRAGQKNILSVETESTRLKCLRNTGKRDDFVMHGTRFPRLTAPKPLSRLKEILVFLNNLPDAHISYQRQECN
jgi:transcription-repair coupling factor (superfamily II helicase)